MITFILYRYFQDSTVKSVSLQDQAALFSDADLIIGPHGAGLTNIMFSPAGSTLLYFPTKPMVDSCFANIAAAVGITVYTVPEVNAYYYGPFHIGTAKPSP